MTSFDNYKHRITVDLAQFDHADQLALLFETFNSFDFNQFYQVPSDLEVGSTTLGGLKAMHCLIAVALRIGHDNSSKYRFLYEMQPSNSLHETALLWLEQNPDAASEGREYLSNIAQFQYPSRLDWQRGFWGSFTNAILPAVSSVKHLLVLEFECSQNPWPIFDALAKRFDFDLEYQSDETERRTYETCSYRNGALVTA